MPDPFGQFLTRLSIRLALVCYAASLGGNLATWKSPSPRWNQLERWLWTVGCGMYLMHFACAMGFYHHWSHLAAYDDTARQTEQMIGFRFGGGVYFSYLFTALWVADVLWRWTMPQLQLPWLRGAIHGYMFFIAFNGAVVFKGGATRVVSLLVCIALAALLAWRMARTKLEPSAPPSHPSELCS